MFCLFALVGNQPSYVQTTVLTHLHTVAQFQFSIYNLSVILAYPVHAPFRAQYKNLGSGLHYSSALRVFALLFMIKFYACTTCDQPKTLYIEI